MNGLWKWILRVFGLGAFTYATIAFHGDVPAAWYAAVIAMMGLSVGLDALHGRRE